MKRTLTTILCLLAMAAIHAQEQKKFSPEQFETELTEFITKEASLSQQETANFFPLLKEMHQKQRAIYGRMRKMKPEDEAECAEAIKESDRLNIELKEIEQQYHEKMLKVLSATKVYKAIKAENRFHRKMMKGWQKPKGRPTDKRH